METLKYFQKNKSLDHLTTGLGKSFFSILKAKEIEFAAPARDICYLFCEYRHVILTSSQEWDEPADFSRANITALHGYRCSSPFHFEYLTLGFPLHAAKASSFVKRVAIKKTI